VKLVEQGKAAQQRDFVLGQFNRTGAIGAAITLYRLSIERAKPDAERESGYQQRDLPGIEGAMKQMERRYVPAMDRSCSGFWLDRYVALPAAQRSRRWMRGWAARCGGGEVGWSIVWPVPPR
jgi:uncharacterized membrane-anchored protein